MWKSNFSIFKNFFRFFRKQQESEIFLKPPEKRVTGVNYLQTIIFNLNTYYTRGKNFQKNYISIFWEFLNFEPVLQVGKIQLEDWNFYHIIRNHFTTVETCFLQIFTKKSKSVHPQWTLLAVKGAVVLRLENFLLCSIHFYF